MALRPDLRAGIRRRGPPDPRGRAAPAVRHTLCPVDFSPHSDKAMAYAGELAQRFRADLTVLHVVYDPLGITCSHIPHLPVEQLREEMIREAEQALQRRVRRRLRFLPRAKAMAVAGPPFRQIIRYAGEHHVDLDRHGDAGSD